MLLQNSTFLVTDLSSVLDNPRNEQVQQQTTILSTSLQHQHRPIEHLNITTYKSTDVLITSNNCINNNSENRLNDNNKSTLNLKSHMSPEKYIKLKNKNIPDPPSPANFHEKLFHSLPLPFHLARACVSTSLNIVSALGAHLIDGPMVQGWNLPTSLVHAGMKSVMMSHPPQSRHGLSLIRFFTSFSFPSFLFNSNHSSCHILEKSLIIENSEELDTLVENYVQAVHSSDRSSASNDAAHNNSHRVTDQSESRPCEKRELQAELITNDKCNPEKLILYLHGGAHIFMSPGTHRGITCMIMKELNTSVLAIDYRLCPEHLFPSAIADALAFYMTLIGLESTRVLNASRNQNNHTHDNDMNNENSSTRLSHLHTSFKWRNNSKSTNIKSPESASSLKETMKIFQPEEIVIMGDSSGACLTLQLLHTIRSANLPFPSGAVLLSPFVDHTCSNDSWRRNWDTDFMSLDYAGVKWALSVYANGESLQHPVVSPMFDQFKNYPPILIQSGDSEVLTDDSVELFKRMKKDGVAVRLELYEGMFHVFHAFPTVKLTNVAMNRMKTFVKDELWSFSHFELPRKNLHLIKQNSHTFSSEMQSEILLIHAE